MKRSTCKALHGACQEEILGATPEEMAENSKKHAMEMMNMGDEAHLEAMESMKQMSQEEQQTWYEEFKAGFENLPEA